MEDAAAVATDGLKEEERMTAGWVVANFGLEDAAVLAVYLYGSRVYGTHGPASDWVLPRPGTQYLTFSILLIQVVFIY
jgi:hypothetical protein